MNSTSPGVRTHPILLARAKLGNRPAAGCGVVMSTGDITMEVLSRSCLRENFPEEESKLSMASGMCPS